MNFDRLSHVVDRAEIGAQREALLAVTIPETVGSFRQLCASFGSRNITELCTRYSDPVKARVLVGIKINGRDDVAQVLKELRSKALRPLTLRITNLPRCMCVILWAAMPP